MKKETKEEKERQNKFPQCLSHSTDLTDSAIEKKNKIIIKVLQKQHFLKFCFRNFYAQTISDLKNSCL